MSGALGRSWQRFWHEPVPAARLAAVRISTGLALATDLCVCHLPYYDYLWGPRGVAPAGYSEPMLAADWRLLGWFSVSAGPAWIGVLFACWLGAAIALTLGIRTREAAVAAWFLTLLFQQRNPTRKNAGDDVLGISLFLLMFVPCGQVWSWDSRRAREPRVLTQVPWGVRLFQIQACLMYLTTGIAKLRGGLDGTWLNGTTLYYVYNDFSMTRWSFAQAPIPPWILALAGYGVLFWELAFTPLVLWKTTRRYALFFGVLFHIGAFLSLRVTWFSFYVLSWYAAWLPAQWGSFPSMTPVLQRRSSRLRAVGQSPASAR